jgi:hypothetical protein
MPEFDLLDTIAILTRTPAILNTLLRGLSSTWVRGNEGKDTWSAFEIVGHLIVGERTDWMVRVRIILENGESRPFDPFDRFAQLTQSQDLNQRGRHPRLGVVTLSQLLATWAVHDLTHLHQLSRVMAHQYRDAVGPWSAYLGVLKCAGHSSP